jgi:hypothetical protein
VQVIKDRPNESLGGGVGLRQEPALGSSKNFPQYGWLAAIVSILLPLVRDFTPDDSHFVAVCWITLLTL